MELFVNFKLLFVVVCVCDGWWFLEIIKYYNIFEVEGIKLMIILDKFKFIELLLNNCYKLFIV